MLVGVSHPMRCPLHVARQSQHKMPINLKPPAARWKPWFSKMTQQKREVGRRWKEMGAVFHQVGNSRLVGPNHCNAQHLSVLSV